MKISNLSTKLKNNVWAKRAAKVGGLYIALEITLAVGALIFVLI